MDDSISSAETELRISPKLVLGLLLALGCLLFLGGEVSSYPWQTVSRIIPISLLLFSLSIGGWVLVDRKPALGRWFTTLALVTAAHVTGFWFNIPDSLVWAAIPTAWAVPLLGFPAAILIAVGESVLVVALARHPAVRRVNYPGLETHPAYAVARRQMWGFGGMLSFEVKGGVDAGRRLMNRLKLCSLAVSLGSVDTLVEHPASMTHAVMPKELRERMGIADGLVRVSVGIEDKDDILADFARGLDEMGGN